MSFKYYLNILATLRSFLKILFFFNLYIVTRHFFFLLTLKQLAFTEYLPSTKPGLSTRKIKVSPKESGCKASRGTNRAVVPTRREALQSNSWQRRERPLPLVQLERPCEAIPQCQYVGQALFIQLSSTVYKDS